MIVSAHDNDSAVVLLRHLIDVSMPGDTICVTGAAYRLAKTPLWQLTDQGGYDVRQNMDNTILCRNGVKVYARAIGDGRWLQHRRPTHVLFRSPEAIDRDLFRRVMADLYVNPLLKLPTATAASFNFSLAVGGSS